MSFKISQLYVYPIKSLGGISMKEVDLTLRGFMYDRYWMIVDAQGRFITQREIPEMALFQTTFISGGISVTFNGSSISIPFDPKKNTGSIEVQIWGDKVLATKESKMVNDWFSTQLQSPVFVVRQAENENRPVQNHEEASVNFPDGNQYLVLGESALNHLNEQLEQPIPIDRFRANIIFEGGTPHIEDTWSSLTINGADFHATKLCSRCPVICIDQATAQRSKEPTRTLATYRVINRKVCFGAFFKRTQIRLHTLKVGDVIAPS